MLKAQISVPDQQVMNAFLHSKTYVVMDENPNSAWNPIIDSCMKACWTITPYEILPAASFESKMRDPKASFLYLSLGRFTKGGPYKFTLINLSMGDASGNLNNLHDVCLIPLSYDEADPYSYDFKIPFFIRFMQEFVKDNKDKAGKDLKEIVQEKAGMVKETTLYVLSSDLEPAVNTVSKINSVYPYKVKIVDEEGMKKALDERNPQSAFVHKVGPDEDSVDGDDCLKFVFNAESCEVYYFDYHKISGNLPNAFLKKDFEKLKQ
jgi:hypothetical protein